MTIANHTQAELHKTLTLPGIWAGLAVGILGSTAIAALNALSTRNAINNADTSMLADTSTWESVFSALLIATVGSIIIGVLVVGSEYSKDTTESGSGKQITTTLLTTPNRTTVLAAKTIVTTTLTFAMTATALAVSAVVAHFLSGGLGVETVSFGQAIARSVGGIVYCVLMGLIASAITYLTRSVVVPLTLLIVNSSLVSVSFLLSKVTVVAHWLPDMAGRNLFGSPQFAAESSFSAVTGGLVMALWAAGLLLVAAWDFYRRDA